nr:uncharacterized protein LOC112745980 [Arachis hypogaea]
MNREYEFQVGLEFKSLSQFKEAVKEHALLNGRDIRFQKKNDKVRCRVVCKGRKGKCKWVCFASKVGGSDCFRIKTLNGKHTCGRIYSGRLASSSWISKKIANNISRGEEMNLATVIQTIQDKYMAISVLVRRTGQRGKQEKRYKGGQSNSFLAGCRPIIGVNGCHLKGDHGQQLLVAVGRDPNDNYFPIAVAAVEAETKDSWGWFLELLLNDIGESRKWVFMRHHSHSLHTPLHHHHSLHTLLYHPHSLQTLLHPITTSTNPCTTFTAHHLTHTSITAHHLAYTCITARCTSITTFAQVQNLWCEKKWKTQDWS